MCAGLHSTTETLLHSKPQVLLMQANSHLTPLQGFQNTSALRHLISQIVPLPLIYSFFKTFHMPNLLNKVIIANYITQPPSLPPHPVLGCWESHILTQTQVISSSLLDKMVLCVMQLLILRIQIPGRKSCMKTGHLS